MENTCLEEYPVLTFILMEIHHSLRVFIEVKDESSTLKTKGSRFMVLSHLKVCQRPERASSGALNRLRNTFVKGQVKEETSSLRDTAVRT